MDLQEVNTSNCVKLQLEACSWQATERVPALRLSSVFRMNGKAPKFITDQLLQTHKTDANKTIQQADSNPQTQSTTGRGVGAILEKTVSHRFLDHGTVTASYKANLAQCSPRTAQTAGRRISVFCFLPVFQCSACS